MTSSSTSPLPNPEGDYIFSPKVIGQSSRTRQEISQYSTPRLGMNIIADGSNIDPDSISMTLYQKLDFSPDADPLGPGIEYSIDDLEHEEVGVFSVVLDPALTSLLSQVALKWQYVIDGATYQYWDYYQILGYMPTYEALNDGEKGVIRQVAQMFEDLYDSVEGGPHLKEEFQTHFGTERIAQMMELAMNRINITSQPYTNYNIGAGTGPRFPESGYSLLVMGTYLEVVRHLIRSYTEMPTMQGSPGVAFYDRSNYVSRWRDILNDESEDYKAAVRSFKRSLMGLGGGALIVAGGIYGSAAYWRSGTYSAMARAARFSYPTSVVQVRPGAF
jgi:hypothetical protein